MATLCRARRSERRLHRELGRRRALRAGSINDVALVDPLFAEAASITSITLPPMPRKA